MLRFCYRSSLGPGFGPPFSTVRLKNYFFKIAYPHPFLVQRIAAVVSPEMCHPVTNAILLGPLVTDDNCRGLQRQPFESADGGHQVIPTAFPIACRVSVEWKKMIISKLNADADLLQCFELPHTSACCLFPQGPVTGIIIHHIKTQATDRRVVACGPSCNRKNEILKCSRVHAREGICRIRDEVCLIIYLTARSQ